MISKKQVQHIAKLARISLTLKEQEKFQKDLSSIFDYFKELEKLNTSKVEPSSQFMSESLDGEQVLLRNDEVKGCENSDELINLAPDKEEKYIKVKPVFENE